MQSWFFSSSQCCLNAMKGLSLTIWIFINLLFFGMIGYMYLLWSKYWISIQKQVETSTFTYDQQIYFYSRGFNLKNLTKTNKNSPTNSSKSQDEGKTRIKHATKDNVTITFVKNQKPRFPYLQPEDFLLDTNKYKCDLAKLNKSHLEDEGCVEKTKLYKEKILNELKRVFMDESNVLKWGSDDPNPYNVLFKGKMLLIYFSIHKSIFWSSTQIKYFIQKTCVDMYIIFLNAKKQCDFDIIFVVIQKLVNLKFCIEYDRFYVNFISLIFFLSLGLE